MTIIGNLTKDPETRNTQNNKTVCNFTVAVNRRNKTGNGEHPETDFFRVAAWGAMGENCQKFLAKGKKVAVIGAVQVRTFTDNNGEFKANLEIPFADEVEFLSPREVGDAQGRASQPVPVENPGDLPF